MSTVGIVCEGPRDFELLSSVIDEFTARENYYLKLQPESDETSKNGAGWKGVWKWCDDHQTLTEQFFLGVKPNMDLLIVHMDADVAVNEKEVHCFCNQEHCNSRFQVHPLQCDLIKERRCPIVLPCELHNNNIDGHISFIDQFLRSRLNYSEGLPIIVVVPCASSDAWIVAAYEGHYNSETLPDPWNDVIVRLPFYHGIRMINRPKKSRTSYQHLIKKVCSEWGQVKELCTAARSFENNVRAILMP